MLSLKIVASKLIIIIIIIIIIIMMMIYLEVHSLGGSSPCKTANYNTSIKALKTISLKHYF